MMCFGTLAANLRRQGGEVLGRDPDLSGGPLREAQQEAAHYPETLEQIIDLCRRVLNDPQNRGRAKAMY